MWHCWLPGCPGWLAEWEDRVMSVGGMEREEWLQWENGRAGRVVSMEDWNERVVSMEKWNGRVVSMEE